MIERLDENGNVTEAFHKYAVECCERGEEIWVDVDGYEESYQISNFGNVKSLARKSWNGKVWFEKEERILSPNMGTNGYLSVQLCVDGNIRRREIHRLQGLNFIPNPENKATINHDNGIKTDLKLTNLFWNTYTENNKHAFRTGLKNPSVQAKRYGKDNPTSKPIAQFSINGNKIASFDSVSIAAKETGVKITNISMCLNNKNHTAAGFVWKYELAS